MQATAAVLLLTSLAGCTAVAQRDASAGEKRSFLLASVAEQSASGPKDCQRYVHGLSTRLTRSPYRYEVQTLYYCSMGPECHVVLKVDTGEEQFASDNGAFIKNNVEDLAAFNVRQSRRLSWHAVHASEARLMLMAERYGSP